MKLTTALASCVVLLAQQALAMSNVEKEMRAEFTMPYKSGESLPFPRVWPYPSVQCLYSSHVVFTDC